MPPSSILPLTALLLLLLLLLCPSLPLHLTVYVNMAPPPPPALSPTLILGAYQALTPFLPPDTTLVCTPVTLPGPSPHHSRVVLVSDDESQPPVEVPGVSSFERVKQTLGLRTTTPLSLDPPVDAFLKSFFLDWAEFLADPSSTDPPPTVSHSPPCINTLPTLFPRPPPSPLLSPHLSCLLLARSNSLLAQAHVHEQTLQNLVESLHPPLNQYMNSTLPFLLTSTHPLVHSSLISKATSTFAASQRAVTFTHGLYKSCLLAAAADACVAARLVPDLPKAWDKAAIAIRKLGREEKEYFRALAGSNGSICYQLTGDGSCELFWETFDD